MRVNLKVIIMVGHKLLFIKCSKIMFNEFIYKPPIKKISTGESLTYMNLGVDYNKNLKFLIFFIDVTIIFDFEKLIFSIVKIQRVTPVS